MLLRQSVEDYFFFCFLLILFLPMCFLGYIDEVKALTAGFNIFTFLSCTILSDGGNKQM